MLVTNPPFAELGLPGCGDFVDCLRLHADTESRIIAPFLVGGGEGLGPDTLRSILFSYQRVREVIGGALHAIGDRIDNLLDGIGD